ncbi:MAG: hypothetical protein Q9M37_06660 [Desulfonauticus sp.]|nr:hypothetical protein [Desulfonauticus sp.]
MKIHIISKIHCVVLLFTFTTLIGNGLSPTWAKECSYYNNASISKTTNQLPLWATNKLNTLGENYRISAEGRKRLLQVLLMAQHKQVSLSLLISKIEEGLAKKVPPQIIAQALLKEIDNYCYVRNLLKTFFSCAPEKLISNKVVKTIVDSLSLGLSRKELAQFIKSAPIAPLSMLAIAIENLALLKQIHFNPDMAKQIMFTGLRYKSFSSDWRYVAKIIALAKKRNLSDKQITKAALQILRHKQHLNKLMELLGFTSRNLQQNQFR